MMTLVKVLGKPVFRGSLDAAKKFAAKIDQELGYGSLLVESQAKTSPATLKRNLATLFGTAVAERVYGTRSSSGGRKRRKSGSASKRRAKRSASTASRKRVAKRGKKSPAKRRSSKTSPKRSSTSKRRSSSRPSASKRKPKAKRTTKKRATKAKAKRSGARKRASSKAPGVRLSPDLQPTVSSSLTVRGLGRVDVPASGLVPARGTQRQRALAEVRAWKKSARAAVVPKLRAERQKARAECGAARRVASQVCADGRVRSRALTAAARGSVRAGERERRAKAIEETQRPPRALLTDAQLAARRRGGVKLAERKQFAIADAVAEGVDPKFARAQVVKAIAKEKKDRAAGGHTTAAEFITHAWGEDEGGGRAARADEHEDAGAAEMARRQRELEDEIPF